MIITANYTEHNGYTALQINYPHGTQFVNVPGGLGEAERLLYYHNRKYITDKLNSWLNQRKKAVKLSPDKSKVLTVAQLQVLLSYYRENSLRQVCIKIKEHRHLIEAIAPDSGMHYNYYNKVIKPILQFCAEVE
ncbi:hypothetical protein KHS38_12025 [Mucilaginibacter sp. Bleaf8]|uniref:hypothetical protein n=1 Tax=Mucilaginibacter sp. Bleaf8 TaxID=2834430 RepID=UPI001BCF6F50|nr:hypothetical protein [Mucilaginibacter sp. Bleaf8]MBS7565132.1 hypothetical protein [Mucilaginibacter sp. Bleaf8]